MADKESDNENVVVRRHSDRNPLLAQLCTSDFINLIEKIKTNHKDTVVLKIKDHMKADINSLVLSEIWKALRVNKGCLVVLLSCICESHHSSILVCQALYAQNLSRAMGDEQLLELLALLTKKIIWCLNLGENYNVTNNCWIHFCKQLQTTYVTHL